jgi:hypothetical protein
MDLSKLEKDEQLYIENPDSVYAEINKEVEKLKQNDDLMIVDDNYTEPEQEDYYMWMLQKVINSIPDVIIDPEYKKDPSSDGESVNEYTNSATIRYFNSFD